MRKECGWSTGQGLCPLPVVAEGRCSYHAACVLLEKFHAGPAPEHLELIEAQKAADATTVPQ